MNTPATLRDIDWSTWQAKDIATLAFVIKDGQILLIRKKRGLGAGKINGPGGRLEANETIADCAVRETQEELGITPLNILKQGELQFQFVDGYSIHAHVYSATDLEGTPIETAEAIPLWTPLDAVPYNEMWADDIYWLPHLIAGDHFHGRFVFDDDKMLDYKLDILTAQ